ncbi:MAG: zf-HC2 domain-containing protein [candidate division FCPU426 bacterium]
MTPPRHDPAWSRELSAWRAGTLPPRREERLRRHLADCPLCAAEDRWEQAMSRALARDYSLRAPADFNHRLRLRLGGLPAPRPYRWHWVPATLGALGVAAAAAALVLSTYRVLQHPPEPPVVTLVQAPQPAQSQAPMPAMTAEEKTARLTPVYTPARTARLETPQVAAAAIPVPTAGQAARPAAEIPRIRGPRLHGQPKTARAPQPLRPAAGEPERQGAAKTALAVSQARLLNNTLHLNRFERARLEFTLDQPGRCRVAVFSREGRPVSTLLDQDLAVGPQAVEWDGTTSSGQKVASGIYVLILSGPGGEERFKVAVIK